MRCAANSYTGVHRCPRHAAGQRGTARATVAVHLATCSLLCGGALAPGSQLQAGSATRCCLQETVHMTSSSLTAAVQACRPSIRRTQALKAGVQLRPACGRQRVLGHASQRIGALHATAGKDSQGQGTAVTPDRQLHKLCLQRKGCAILLRGSTPQTCSQTQGR